MAGLWHLSPRGMLQSGRGNSEGGAMDYLLPLALLLIPIGLMAATIQAIRDSK